MYLFRKICNTQPHFGFTTLRIFQPNKTYKTECTKPQLKKTREKKYGKKKRKMK